MSLTNQNSLRASFLFLGGLILSATLAISQDSAWRIATQRNVVIDLGDPSKVVLQSPSPLSPQDIEASRIAWDYITSNTRPESGLADSVAGFSSATLWDMGSNILAVVAARRLELISQEEFDQRAEKIVETIAALPLIDGRLPNKVYDTRSLTMVDYTNTPVDGGIGWSAMDIGRLLLSLRALEGEAPQLRPAIRAAVRPWDLDALASAGELFGAVRENGSIKLVQEGRVGYEQYAARALMLWGVEATSALSAARILDWKRVETVDVATDLRRTESFGSIDPVSSEPYVLLGLELGLNGESAVLAERVYLAQEARHLATGQLTMVTEDHLDRAPHFAYGTVFGNGSPWAVLTEDGTNHENLRTISSKAVFGWNALYGTSYSFDLRTSIEDLSRPGHGWVAGRYEADGSPNEILTINTNAIILESMHYKMYGPIIGN